MVASKPFENAVNFKQLDTRVTSVNYITEEIKKVLNSVHACYRSFQKAVTVRVLPSNVQIQYKQLLRIEDV
jgi:hypothetical protein